MPQTLEERCKQVWNQMGVSEDKQTIMLANLNPEATAHPEMVTDEMIHNHTAARLLFWGLGEALCNYVAVCEKLSYS